mgnify:CR=1 FL=1
MPATGRRALACLAVIAALAIVPRAADAQASWPSKPVRLIAVFPPGGSVDQVARILAAQGVAGARGGYQFANCGLWAKAIRGDDDLAT